MENKNQITLVRLIDPSIQREAYGPVANGFGCMQTYILSVGDISSIINYNNELILACQDGLFVANIDFKKIKNQTKLIITKLLAQKMGIFAKKKVHLTTEKYLEGERISQVVFAGNSTIEARSSVLLVTVWNKPGYYLIDRVDKKVTHIEASTQKDQFCTDLTVLDPSLSQFFVARSSQSLSIVDVRVGKAYPLIVS